MGTIKQVLAACAVALFFACSKTETPAPVAAPSSPAPGVSKPAVTPSADPAQSVLARGQYLAAAGDCYACHTQRGQPAFAGGLEMATPFGRLYTSNITPDKETGIGTWSADDFWRAMHEGKSKDGSYLYPAMPFTNYTKVTREDSDAIYAYFMSVQPVRRKNRPHEMSFPFNQRELLAGWRTLFFKQGVYEADPKQSAVWNRGAYLVEGLGHCNACHGTRNLLGAVSNDDISGGLIPLQNWYAPALTSSRETGLGDWDEKQIVELLRTGVSERGAVFGPMAAVVQHSLQVLSMADLSAMATYLKAQSEKKQAAAAPPGSLPDALTQAMMKSGAKVYQDHCEKCHQAQGQGVPRIYPPLANNESIAMRNPVNAIRIVLNGGFPPSTEGNPRPYGMPPFYQELSDEQIAAVVTFIRQSWGNNAPPTWSVEVSRSRGVPAD
jgi:mono/diheme cytochrome c family protein